MSEEILKTTVDNEDYYVDYPTYEEPSKDIKIGTLDITLCNEMIQEINETLNVTFTCDSEIELIQDAFVTNEDPIVYGDDSYTGYTVIDEFGYKVNNEDKIIYHVALSKPIKEEPVAELTTDQEYAINCAVMLMSDSQALNCISVFPTSLLFLIIKLQASKLLHCMKESMKNMLEHWKIQFHTLIQ